MDTETVTPGVINQYTLYVVTIVSGLGSHVRETVPQVSAGIIAETPVGAGGGAKLVPQIVPLIDSGEKTYVTFIEQEKSTALPLAVPTTLNPVLLKLYCVAVLAIVRLPLTVIVSLPLTIGQLLNSIVKLIFGGELNVLVQAKQPKDELPPLRAEPIASLAPANASLKVARQVAASPQPGPGVYASTVLKTVPASSFPPMA